MHVESIAAIRPGVMIRCTTATGATLETKALSTAFWNTQFCGRREPWLVVSVQPPDWEHPINWPAEDVVVIE